MLMTTVSADGLLTRLILGPRLRPAAMPTMTAVTAVPKHVHQRTRQDDEKRQQLPEMGAVAEEQPSHCRGQPNPEHPLVDTRPVGTIAVAFAFVEVIHELLRAGQEAGSHGFVDLRVIVGRLGLRLGA